jgi:hypothetical protein
VTPDPPRSMESLRFPAGALRIGVLGAARITELALIGPAKATGARLVAVAARERSQAEAFAARHGVERVVARGSTTPTTRCTPGCTSWCAPRSSASCAPSRSTW